MNILDRYIIKTVLFSTFMFLFIVLALYGFISLADSFKYVGRGSFSATDAFYYTALSLPRRLYELFPSSVLLGTMMGLGTLNSNSELVVIRAAGVSVSRIIFSAMKAAFFLALLMIAIGEYIVPLSQKTALNHYTTQVYGASSVITKDAVWVRDKDTFTKIHSIDTDNTLRNINIFTFNEDKTLKVSTHAASAHFDNKNWILKDIRQTFIADNKVIVNEIEQARWPTLLDLELVDVIVSKLEYLSVFGLYRYALYLDDNNLDSAQYWGVFWAKVISPFSIVAMLLLAVPFVFDSSRTSNAGSRLMVGVFIGICYTIANKITSQFGLVYNIPPFLSASLITLATIAIAALLIRRIN